VTQPYDKTFQPEEEQLGGPWLCPGCLSPCEGEVQRPNHLLAFVSPCCRKTLGKGDANSPQHLHAGCDLCKFLGRVRLKAESRRGLPDMVELPYDLWYCPQSGFHEAKYSTVSARFTSEIEGYYCERLPLRTDKPYEPAIREAAQRASRRGLLFL
jgi:hypothetical protein